MKPKDENVLYFGDNTKKSINKTKVAGLIIISILILLITIFYAIYAGNERVRTFFDEHLLHKDIEGDNLKYIRIEDYDKSNIFAFSDYIAVLKDNKLSTYSSSGKKEAENKIEISTPITSSSGKYLSIAEQDASKIYLLAGNTIKWEKDLEGTIERVNVNSFGYTSVILSGTAYKSVVVLFDDSGNEIFKHYLANTIAVDSDISDDNKYLSVAEVNTSGTLIQSTIKIISVEEAKQHPSEAIVYTYKAPTNSCILNIKYQSKWNLVCQYNTGIHLIKDNTDTQLTDIDSKQEKITFASIELNNHILKNVEESSDLFNTTTVVKIMNSSSKKENIYKFEGVAKELYCSHYKIALNLGTEIHFIDTNGWLIKKYSSNKEIRKVVITDEIAGIVYRDKVEIVKL